MNTENTSKDEFAALQDYDKALDEMLSHFSDIPPKYIATINHGAIRFEAELNQLSSDHTWHEILEIMREH